MTLLWRTLVRWLFGGCPVNPNTGMPLTSAEDRAVQEAQMRYWAERAGALERGLTIQRREKD